MDDENFFDYLARNESKPELKEAPEDLIMQKMRYLIDGYNKDMNEYRAALRANQSNARSSNHHFKAGVERARTDLASTGNKWAPLFSPTNPHIHHFLMQLHTLGPHFRKSNILKISSISKFMKNHGEVRRRFFIFFHFFHFFS